MLIIINMRMTSELLNLIVFIKIIYWNISPYNSAKVHLDGMKFFTDSKDYDKCNNCFWVENQTKSWSDALHDCEGKNATLAMFPKGKWMDGMLSENEIKKLLKTPTWIGLSQGHTKGIYRWINTRVLNFSFFEMISEQAVDEILNVPGDCVTIGGTGTPVKNCSDVYPYMCMKKKNNNSQCTTLKEGCLGVRNDTWECSTLVTCDEPSDSITYDMIDTIEICQQLCQKRIDFNCRLLQYDSMGARCILRRVADANATIGVCSNYTFCNRTTFFRDFGNVCIDLREEWLYGKKLKTDDYEKKCAEENGTLLTIRNLQEHEYVKKMLMKSYTTGMWFIGLSRTTPGHWIWLDKTYPEWQFWAEAEPNISVDVNCVVITNISEWKAECVHQYQRQFICEKPLEIVCASFPLLENTTMSHTDNTVTYTCTNGNVFSDGRMSTTIVCSCDMDISQEVENIGYCIYPTSHITITSDQNLQTTTGSSVMLSSPNETTYYNGFSNNSIHSTATSYVTKIMDHTSYPDTIGTTIQASNQDSTSIYSTVNGDVTERLDHATDPGTIDTTIQETNHDSSSIYSTVNADVTQSLDHTTNPEATRVTAIAETNVIGTITQPSNMFTTEGPSPLATNVYTSTTQHIPVTSHIYLQSSIVSTTTTTTTTTTKKVIKCGDPPVVKNAIIAESIPILGGYTVYQCNNGHLFQDGSYTRSIICLNNGIWSAIPSECMQKSCSEVQLGDTNSIVTNGNDDIVTRHFCHNPLKFNSGLNHLDLKCTSRSQWHDDSSRCTVRCQPLPYIENGMVQQPIQNMIGSIATVTCLRGHRFNDGQSTKQTECQSGGTWQDIGNCIIEVCPALISFYNAFLSTTMAVYGTTVEIRCEDGFTFNTSTNTAWLQCMEYGQWNDTYLSDCIEVSCPLMPVVLNAIQIGNGSSFADVQCYQCNNTVQNITHRHVDGHTLLCISCLQSGKWSQTELSCEVGRCEPLPEIDYAKPDSVLASFGSIARYSCAEGYQFTHTGLSQESAVCAAGKWNITTAYSCKRIRCGALPYIPNSIASTPLSSFYGDNITIWCQEGYLLDNNTTLAIIQCDKDGHWKAFHANIQDGCKAISCNDPPNVINAYLSNYNNNNTLGDRAEYNCRYGYWFSRDIRSKMVYCSLYGTWLPALNNCTEITCPAFATWNGMVANTSERTLNSNVNVTCIEGMVLDTGESYETYHCAVTGEWDKRVALCIDRNPKEVFVPHVQEAENSAAIGFLGVSLVACVFVIFLVIDAPALIMALNRTRKNNIIFGVIV